MSISPVSDIVLDVAMAADPAKYRAAAEKLSAGGTATQGLSGRFESTLTNTIAKMPDAWKNFAAPGLSAATRFHATNTSARAYKGLEQLVLKNLVETMLPNNSSALFGSGTAGDMWRSMLANQLASAIGNTVDLGTARRQTNGVPSAALTEDADERPPFSPARGRLRNEV